MARATSARTSPARRGKAAAPAPVAVDGAEAGERPRVQSVARAVGILFAIAQSPDGLTTTEISQRLRLSRPTTYHLIHTLVGTGMITRADNHRYIVGLRVATLTEAFRRQFVPTEYLTRYIREIARLTGESAYAVGWWNGEIAILGQVQGSNAVRAAENQLGPYSAANARASGKLMLAYATPTQRRDYLDRHPPVRCTQYTITDAARLEKEFAAIVRRGYATDEQEFAEGLSCMAVPVDGGASPFGLVLSAPTARFKQKRAEYLQVARTVAASLSGGGVETA